MPDIRKMLEKQLEILQDASMNTEVAAECSYAMIEIIDVLYPEGIPEANVELDAEEITCIVTDHHKKQSRLIIGDRSLVLRIE